MPAIAPEIVKDPWCTMDSFSQAWLTRFRTDEDLQSQLCRELLVVLAMFISMNIVRLENRFGWLRRFKGIIESTHLEEMQHISAHFVSCRQRVIETNLPCGQSMGNEPDSGQVSMSCCAFAASLVGSPLQRNILDHVRQLQAQKEMAVAGGNDFG